MEWYYDTNSYFAIDGFVKEVTDFIITGSQTKTLNTIVTPCTLVPQCTIDHPVAAATHIELGGFVAGQRPVG